MLLPGLDKMGCLFLFLIIVLFFTPASSQNGTGGKCLKIGEKVGVKTDCRKYWECQGKVGAGRYVTVSCPNKYLLDDRLGKCVPESKINNKSKCHASGGGQLTRSQTTTPTTNSGGWKRRALTHLPLVRPYTEQELQQLNKNKTLEFTTTEKSSRPLLATQKPKHDNSMTEGLQAVESTTQIPNVIIGRSMMQNFKNETSVKVLEIINQTTPTPHDQTLTKPTDLNENTQSEGQIRTASQNIIPMPVQTSNSTISSEPRNRTSSIENRTQVSTFPDTKHPSLENQNASEAKTPPSIAKNTTKTETSQNPHIANDLKPVNETTISNVKLPADSSTISNQTKSTTTEKSSKNATLPTLLIDVQPKSTLPSGLSNPTTVRSSVVEKLGGSTVAPEDKLGRSMQISSPKLKPKATIIQNSTGLKINQSNLSLPNAKSEMSKVGHQILKTNNGTKNVLRIKVPNPRYKGSKNVTTNGIGNWTELGTQNGTIIPGLLKEDSYRNEVKSSVIETDRISNNVTNLPSKSGQIWKNVSSGAGNVRGNGVSSTSPSPLVPLLPRPPTPLTGTLATSPQIQHHSSKESTQKNTFSNQTGKAQTNSSSEKSVQNQTSSTKKIELQLQSSNTTQNSTIQADKIKITPEIPTEKTFENKIYSSDKIQVPKNSRTENSQKNETQKSRTEKKPSKNETLSSYKSEGERINSATKNQILQTDSINVQANSTLTSGVHNLTTMNSTSRAKVAYNSTVESSNNFGRSMKMPSQKLKPNTTILRNSTAPKSNKNDTKITVHNINDKGVSIINGTKHVLRIKVPNPRWKGPKNVTTNGMQNWTEKLANESAIANEVIIKGTKEESIQNATINPGFSKADSFKINNTTKLMPKLDPTLLSEEMWKNGSSGAENVDGNGISTTRPTPPTRVAVHSSSAPPALRLNH